MTSAYEIRIWPPAYGTAEKYDFGIAGPPDVVKSGVRQGDKDVVKAEWGGGDGKKAELRLTPEDALKFAEQLIAAAREILKKGKAA